MIVHFFVVQALSFLSSSALSHSYLGAKAPCCYVQPISSVFEPRSHRDYGRRLRQSDVPAKKTYLHMRSEVPSNSVDLNSFHDWLGKSGMKINDQLALAGRSQLSGKRGLVAVKSIENGKPVVAVPYGLCLSASSLPRSEIAKFVTDFQGWTGDTGLIALQLLWEKAQGDKSTKAPWIDVLPSAEELDIPLFWNQGDLELADASTTRGISGFGADVAEDYAWLAKNVFEPNSDTFPEAYFGPEQFRWAVGIALSRSFFVDGELRLAPLVDFANHSRRATREPTGGSTGLFGSKAVVLTAAKNYAEGEEFFVSYGPKGAAGYLEENGFVPPTSGSETTSEIEFSLEKNDKFFDDKEDILQQQGLDTSATFDLTAAGLPDAELVQFLRLSLLDGEDAFLLEGLFRREVWTFMSEPVSRSNEEAVNRAIMARCSAELDALCGTAEDEENIISGKSEATHHQRLCAFVRQGERLALERTRDWCETDNKALDRKEYYQERRLKELQLDIPLDDDEIVSADGTGGGMRRDMDW